MGLARIFRFLAFIAATLSSISAPARSRGAQFYAWLVTRLTPASGAYSGCADLRQTARHSHSAIIEITSPNSSRAAAHTSADTKLATWKRQYGISKMPAASGTEARNGPKNRPMKMDGTPQFFTNVSPRGSKSG